LEDRKLYDIGTWWNRRLADGRVALIPTADGRLLRLSRYTQPEAEHSILQQQLRLCLPEQPQPKISATLARKHARQAVPV